MTVYELADLYIGSKEDMQIWNGSTEKTVFEGSFDGAKRSNYAEYEVGSFGIENGMIVINIFEE